MLSDLEINMQALFESLQSIVWYVDSMVYVDDGILVDSKTGNMVDYQYYLDKPVTKEPILYEDKEAVVVISQKVESQYITYMIKLDKVAIVNENDIIIYMFIIFMLFMIPLVIIIFYFFHKNVSQPISKLVLVSQEIEKGNFEVRLPALTQNAEFNYLGETF